jgi:amidase
VPEFGIVPTTESKLYGPAHNPWNLGTFDRRIVRRIGGRGRGAHRAHRPCDGRRRLDPHSRVVLRPRRPEGFARADHARPRRADSHQRAQRRSCRDAQRARHARRRSTSTRRSIYGDPYFAPPPKAPISKAIAQAEAPAIAVSFKGSNGTPHHPDVTRAVRRRRSCARISATMSKKPRRHSMAEMTPAFLTLWAATRRWASNGSRDDGHQRRRWTCSRA